MASSGPAAKRDKFADGAKSGFIAQLSYLEPPLRLQIHLRDQRH